MFYFQALRSRRSQSGCHRVKMHRPTAASSTGDAPATSERRARQTMLRSSPLAIASAAQRDQPTPFDVAARAPVDDKAAPVASQAVLLNEMPAHVAAASCHRPTPPARGLHSSNLIGFCGIGGTRGGCLGGV